ncbi:DUF4260 domain-containing protein [Paenibacillus sedimenti]|uniref:DUF4260 domain-containing protein n=1 Tax=Paenibacillus sedimenti TaxID=2770274 RepID=A0A926KVB7_9BACL|nr:DUF4260 domain-containing protein [Paenibacillus sedimenti]MBD0384872.1 DUF4260 domain-containing protein [Paenibacillus sedimenti]
MVKYVIRLEGLLVFLACFYTYFINDFRLIWFFVFLLLPDLSMIGYVRGNDIGAKVYNLFHTYLVSGIFIFFGTIFDQSLLLQTGLIWTAHIGIDRLAGYGLKYSTDFKDTHINKI